MRTFRKLDSAIRITALFFAGEFVILQVMQWVLEGLSLAEHFWLGNDFEYLYTAAGLFLTGKSPYLDPDFIPLPPALYLPVLLHRLPFWNAFTAFRLVSFCLVVVAIVWLCRQLHFSLLNTALMVLIAITYAPFYQVLTGGNLDALMLAFIVFACASKEALRGAFLGISIGTKFYSLLLIPVLAWRRRWRELLWAGGILLLLLLPFLRYLPDALSSVFHRTAVLRLDGNESPAVLFILIFGAERKWAWRTCYVLLWGGTLLARLVSDYKRRDPVEERFVPLDYIPWMAAAPALVFTYTGTILLGYVTRLFGKDQRQGLDWPEWISVTGFLLTGIYPFLIKRTILYFSPRFPDAQLSLLLMLVAPLGVSAILVGSALSGWRERYNVRAVYSVVDQH